MTKVDESDQAPSYSSPGEGSISKSESTKRLPPARAPRSVGSWKRSVSVSPAPKLESPPSGSPATASISRGGSARPTPALRASSGAESAAAAAEVPAPFRIRIAAGAPSAPRGVTRTSARSALPLSVTLSPLALTMLTSNVEASAQPPRYLAPMDALNSKSASTRSEPPETGPPARSVARSKMIPSTSPSP